jgi:hypothetical protein
MISTAEMIRRITAAAAPVLLCDTCSLLDLVREPREGFTKDHLDAALRLVGRTEAGTLWIVVTDQALIELKHHRTAIQQEAETAIRELEQRVNRVRSIMSVHGLHTTVPALVAAGLPATAQLFLQRYIDAATHTSTPKGAQARAFLRIGRSIAPAQKGQQAKDCIILESYLTLVRGLRAEGIGDPIVFFTTNTPDYSEQPRKGDLHTTLVAEFNTLQLRYAVNFEMAEHRLK